MTCASDYHDPTTLEGLAGIVDNLSRHLLSINDNDIRQLKTQLSIILGNINGISDRLDRLEQAHGDLVLQYHQGIAECVQQLERHVLEP